MWKQVQGYENIYEVSDHGEVRSIDRSVNNYRVKGRVLRQHDSGKGYPAVALCKNGKPHTTYVHSLVANAFIPKPDTLLRLVVNHKDGDKRNNDVTNLEWVSYSQNNQHAYDNNLKERGEQFYNTKLTEAQVKEIRKNGKYDTYEQIAQQYGVSKATIRDVLLHNDWKHIQ